MPAQAFAQAIIGQLNGAIGTDGNSFTTGSASIAMTAVATAMTNYIVANTLVTVTYAGIIPGVPPSPDPLITDVFNIIGTVAPTGPSDGFDSWIKLIEANIIAGFTLAPMGTAGLVFPTVPFANPGIMTTQAQLYAVHDITDASPQLKVWTVVCQGIMDWINGLAFNAVPGACTNSKTGSAGTASIVKIVIT